MIPVNMRTAPIRVRSFYVFSGLDSKPETLDIKTIYGIIYSVILWVSVFSAKRSAYTILFVK